MSSISYFRLWLWISIMCYLMSLLPQGLVVLGSHAFVFACWSHSDTYKSTEIKYPESESGSSWSWCIHIERKHSINQETLEAEINDSGCMSSWWSLWILRCTCEQTECTHGHLKILKVFLWHCLYHLYMFLCRFKGRFKGEGFLWNHVVTFILSLLTPHLILSADSSRRKELLSTSILQRQ